MSLPVFQDLETDRLDQKVLGGRASPFLFISFFLFKSVLEQTSPNSPSAILDSGLELMKPQAETCRHIRAESLVEGRSAC